MRYLHTLTALALFFGLLSLSGNRRAEPTEQEKNVKNTTAALKEVAKQAKKEDTLQQLHLVFVGDIMGQSTQIKSAEIAPNQYNYKDCYRYIRPMLEKADLAFGNLELTLPGHPPYTGYPCFKSPDELAEALKYAGFDVLVTANNHSNDAGLNGVRKTIQTVKNNGFYQTGTFQDDEDRDVFYPLLLFKNGFKIALLNATMHTNGLPTPEPTVVNRLDLQQIEKDLVTAKAFRPDLIIAFLHWGEEYQLLENSEQRGVAKRLHEAGVDILIGSHPHVVQPIKYEPIAVGKYVRPCITAYSLGNFISDQPYNDTEGGIAFEVKIEKKGSRSRLVEWSYMPIYRYTPYEDGQRKFYALPVSPYEKDSDTFQMQPDQRLRMTAWAERTRKRLNQFGAKENLSK